MDKKLSKLLAAAFAVMLAVGIFALGRMLVIKHEFR